jgi:hypothetical protein
MNFGESSNGGTFGGRLVELLKKEYALTIIMPIKKEILAIKLNVKCVEIINLLTSRYDMISQICHAKCYQRRFLLLAKPRCLTFCIFDLDITICHFVKVTR